MNSKTTRIWTTLRYLAVIPLIVLGVLSIVGKGGGGSSGGVGGPSSLTVAGSVQAPNGQVVMHQAPGTVDRWLNYFLPSANATVSGISPVPDGTQVDLVRIDDMGTVVDTLATTTTISGGRYSFNLTALGLNLSSDLVVHVAGGGGAELRAFVTQNTVNIDPDSEAAVSLILDNINANPGTTLADFTPQELNDLVASIDLLTRVNQIAAGVDIATTVTAIKNAVLADAGISTFIDAAAQTGQTTQGPGDIGNYFPFTQGLSATFSGTVVENGGAPVSFSNTLSITGTRDVSGTTTTVFTESNPGNSGQVEETLLVKDSRGISDWTLVETGELPAPFDAVRFPLKVGSTLEQLNAVRLDLGEDLDGDGINESAITSSQVTVVGFEPVVVAAGSFNDAVKIETRITLSGTSSGIGIAFSGSGTATEWFAPGVGPVKRISQIEVRVDSQTASETISEELL